MIQTSPLRHCNDQGKAGYQNSEIKLPHPPREATLRLGGPCSSCEKGAVFTCSADPSIAVKVTESPGLRKKHRTRCFSTDEPAAAERSRPWACRPPTPANWVHEDSSYPESDERLNLAEVEARACSVKIMKYHVCRSRNI